MNPRVLPFFVFGLAIALVCGGVMAQEKDQVARGTIASVAKDTLALRIDKQQYNFVVSEDTKVTLDGKRAKVSDLKAGHKAAVTWQKQGDKLLAKMIEATSGQKESTPLLGFLAEEDNVFEGKIVSAAQRSLALNVKGQQRNFLVNATTKITLDGKEAKISELKAGHMAKVTAAKQGELLVAKTIVAKSAE